MPDLQNRTPEELRKIAAEMQRKENEGLTPEEIEEKNRQKEIRKKKNIALLDETLAICRNGCYEKDSRQIRIGLSEEEMSEIHVFLPDEIQKLPEPSDAENAGPCRYSCENRDALSLAEEKIQDPSYREEGVLVLNLASASRPGGAVRDGANGQEEDLCRRSSLLYSLESAAAGRCYEYNKALNTRLGSDAVMITPNAAVMRDEKGELLPQPFRISVLSCSAPMIRLGLEGKSEEEYKDLLFHRICGILLCASSMGYRNLILGAFGCGAFGNDAAVVSDTFKKALSGPDGKGFAHADFAVLCTEGKEYNYQEFCRNFGS